MILVCKNKKVIAFHTDEQEYVVDRYPADCEILKVDDSKVEFDEEGFPKYPEKGAENLRVKGSIEQRLRDIEMALATILGGGQV